MITFSQSGKFNKTEQFLNHIVQTKYRNILERYGQEGVDALALATPIDSGKTASSWYYEIKETKNSYVITWSNSNVVDGVPIAILLQYGHGTRNGGYVQGQDYINPAIKPIFDRLAEAAWREVISI